MRPILIVVLLALAAPSHADHFRGRPADGFWFDPNRPGTGLHMQMRGNTLAVTRFDFARPPDEARPRWDLGVAPLVGNVAELSMQRYEGGSCFGCSPHSPPSTVASESLTLWFLGSRRAYVPVPGPGNFRTPLIAMPFGVKYVSVGLFDWLSDDGVLPLPELEGRWGIGGSHNGVFRIGRAKVGVDQVVFELSNVEGAVTLLLECPLFNPDGTGCALRRNSPFTRHTGWAALEWITENSIRLGEVAGAFFAVRIPEGGPDDTTPLQPASGFWADPDRPGTGLHLLQRGDTLAVSQFDFDDDGPKWWLGTTNDTGNTREIALATYSDGSCSDCEPHRAPHPATTAPLVLQFESARRARATWNGRTVNLVNLAFGVDYVATPLAQPLHSDFAPLPLPDMAGVWAFEDGPLIRFEDAQPDGTGAVQFVGQRGVDRLTLRCQPGTESSDAYCELRPVGPQTTTTPGLHPIARLGDIEEHRARFRWVSQPGSNAWQVGYMVRVPAE
jgi:hypothetical protein